MFMHPSYSQDVCTICVSVKRSNHHPHQPHVPADQTLHNNQKRGGPTSMYWLPIMGSVGSAPHPVKRGMGRKHSGTGNLTKAWCQKSHWKMHVHTYTVQYMWCNLASLKRRLTKVCLSKKPMSDAHTCKCI